LLVAPIGWRRVFCAGHCKKIESTSMADLAAIECDCQTLAVKVSSLNQTVTDMAVGKQVSVAGFT
jgi:hypothetical protein